jgi:xanthine/CO dehydrogenase XdhC/CoxF family maturation factor
MKHWQETSQIVGRVTELAAAGRRAALATVVRIDGSAYRRPGAKLLVEESGATRGGVSGGCLEADVREIAMTVMRDGEPRLRHYETGDDDRTVWGLGLGCNGSVDIFIQPVTSGDTVDAARHLRTLLAGDAPFALSTVVRGPSAVLGRMLVAGDAPLAGSTGSPALDRVIARRAEALVAAGESECYDIEPTGLDIESTAGVFTEVHVPPPRLVICGAGDDAMPLAAHASQIGYRVTVVDHRPAYLSPERFPDAERIDRRPDDGLEGLPLGPRTHLVVMTHSFAHDREWVGRLLLTDVPYVGLLGPRARGDEILEQIGTTDARIGATGKDRLFAPVGLDLGADGPEQIAVSILAELLAVRAASVPRHLREKEGVIHAV